MPDPLPDRCYREEHEHPRSWHHSTAWRRWRTSAHAGKSPAAPALHSANVSGAQCRGVSFALEAAAPPAAYPRPISAASHVKDGRFPLMWMTSGYRRDPGGAGRKPPTGMSSGATGLIDSLLAGRDLSPVILNILFPGCPADGVKISS